MKYINLFEEFVEPKKEKRPYGTKIVPISKIDLERICEILELPFDKVKYITAGKYGNAYKIDDKIIKITTDKAEAEDVYNLINSNRDYSSVIVDYYDIFRYKIRGIEYYVILMDYVIPLETYIKKIKNTDQDILVTYLYELTEVIYSNWENINSIDDFDEKFQYDVPDSGFQNFIFHEIWRIFITLKRKFKISQPIDIHPGNMGLTSDNKLVLFDFTSSDGANKFDKPRLEK